MVKRIAVRAVCFSLTFCLFGTSAAVCQSEHAGVSPRTQFTATKPEIPRQMRLMASSLPDSPAPRRAGQTVSFRWVGMNAGTQGGTGLPAGFRGAQSLTSPQSLTTEGIDRPLPEQRDSSAFFRKFLYPSVAKQGARYQASSSDRLMGRATDAATRVFLTRDETGRKKVNTSYFVGVLTMLAEHRAERPYWARSNSVSAPLSDFGSTLGNDAGMNLLHEFGPGLRQMMTAHTPAFVSKIEERISRSLMAKGGASYRDQ